MFKFFVKLVTQILCIMIIFANFHLGEVITREAEVTLIDNMKCTFPGPGILYVLLSVFLIGASKFSSDGRLVTNRHM